MAHSYRITLKCAHLIFSSRYVVATLALFASSSTRFSSLFLSDRRLASSAMACGGQGGGGHQVMLWRCGISGSPGSNRRSLETSEANRRRGVLPHLWGALTSGLDALVEVLPEALVREAAGVELCAELPHGQLARRNDVPFLVDNAVPDADELPVNLAASTGQEEHDVRPHTSLNLLYR